MAQLRKWTATRLGALGFLLGAIYIAMETSFLHPNSAMSRTPLFSAAVGGPMGLVVFYGAAISYRRFQRSMSKWTWHLR